MPSILNLAAYRFVPLEELATWRDSIHQQAAAAGLRGTVLLSPEGINLFVAGEEAPTRAWWAWLTGHEPFAGLEVKESWSDDQPFSRMLVRLKREIIAFGVRGIEPGKQTSPKLSADQLKQWLDQGRDVTLLDVRNDYEVRVGTFENALPIGVDHFRDFPTAVECLPAELKSKPVVMFCTGGIRCEKAGPLMEREGFEQIYQLDGGILKYLEVVPETESRFAGECFVFDERVSVTHGLQEGEALLCRACRNPMLPHEAHGNLCPACATATPEGAAERERQMELAEARGDAHLGDDAITVAARNKARKLALKERSRSRQGN